VYKRQELHVDKLGVVMMCEGVWNSE